MLATREQLGRFSRKKNKKTERERQTYIDCIHPEMKILSIYTSAVTCACPCLTCVCVVIGQPAETSLLAAAASPALNSSLAVGRNPVALSAHCQITRVSFVPEKKTEEKSGSLKLQLLIHMLQRSPAALSNTPDQHLLYTVGGK